MVDLAEIEKLIALMKTTGVMELAVEAGDFKVKLRRADASPLSLPPQPASREEEEDFGGEVPPENPTEITAVFTTPIISPLVGIFHNGGMSDRRSPLREGDKVKEGQIIAAIEAMKVPHELRSPLDGIISRILVEDGSGVEFGQTLLLLKPES
jgi:acetyl-CoA carboxylase biotin carboxyl carrier protein